MTSIESSTPVTPQTLFRIGCSRGTIAFMQTAEIVIVAIGALVLAAIGTLVLITISPDLAGTLER